MARKGGRKEKEAGWFFVLGTRERGKGERSGVREGFCKQRSFNLRWIDGFCETILLWAKGRGSFLEGEGEVEMRQRWSEGWSGPVGGDCTCTCTCYTHMHSVHVHPQHVCALGGLVVLAWERKRYIDRMYPVPDLASCQRANLQLFPFRP